MLRTRTLLTSFSTALTQYLTPYSLKLQTTPQIPKLKLKSQKLILQNWWSTPPFESTGDLVVPVFNFKSNQFNGKSVQLPSQIFNQPLRRDLIFRLHIYRSKLNKFRTKMTRNRAMTAGSGAKIRPQKKTGQARQGDKRAPHLKKGGKAHGAKPKIYSISLNSKIKYKALCSLLTAKLAQGRIRIIDQQTLSQPKTRTLQKILDPQLQDDRIVVCFITSSNVDRNFSYAYRSMKRAIWHDSQNLDVKSLFIADKIYITLKGLEQLIQNMLKTKYIIYRQPHMPNPETPAPSSSSQSQQAYKWNPDQPYEFKYRILAEYLQLYEKVKKQTPELLQHQLGKIRKIEQNG